MTIPTPFTDQFPLKDPPFNSRVRDQIDSAKNYYMLGFKPGFPLQAQELNELQEIFYIQQTLTLSLISNWSTDTLTAEAKDLNGAPWNGCTPLSPSLVTKSGTNITFNAGWYLLKKPEFASGLGIWVYNDSPITFSITFGADYGVNADAPSVVQCTTKLPGQEAAGEDATLQDSSGLSVINGPCGAARKAIENITFVQGASLKILEVSVDGAVKFLNGRPIT